MQQVSLLKGKQPLTIPVYVISRGEFQQGSLTEETILAVNQNWNKLQSEIAHTSSKHKHLIANESGHFIHCEKPEMVAELILTMIKEMEKISYERMPNEKALTAMLISCRLTKGTNYPFFKTSPS